MKLAFRVLVAVATLSAAFVVAPAALADDPVTITCPAAISVEADQLGAAFVTPGSATASSTVPGAVTITGPAAGIYPLGTTIVAYTATDSAGNSASCATSITVVDTTAPTIVCPAPARHRRGDAALRCVRRGRAGDRVGYRGSRHRVAGHQHRLSARHDQRDVHRDRRERQQL